MSLFKIALPGFDVKRSRLQEEALDSRYANPKINTAATPPHAGIIYLDWKSATQVVSYGTVRVLYSFAHGYNYVPTVLGSFHFDNGSTVVNGVLPFQYGALGIILLDSDRTNVRLVYQSLDPSSAAAVTPFIMQIRFYVFAERGYE